MMIEYARATKDVVPPTRSNPSDAGLDIHAHIPDKKITINPGENAIIPTGLKFGIPHGYMLQVCNRSGMGAKRSLIVGAHIIDSGYDGEVFIDLHNIGQRPQLIEHYDKIAQIVMVPVVSFRALETSQDNLYKWYPITISDRGDGSLGSTGQ